MKPLERMTDIIQKAESGDLSNMYHRRYGSDEIGESNTKFGTYVCSAEDFTYQKDSCPWTICCGGSTRNP